MVQVVPRRLWRGLESKVIVSSELAVVDVALMPEREFREFVLWKLGAAHPKPRAAEASPRPGGRRSRLKYSAPPRRAE